MAKSLPKGSPTKATATRGGVKLSKPKVGTPKASLPARPKTGTINGSSSGTVGVPRPGSGPRPMPRPTNLGTPTINGLKGRKG